MSYILIIINTVLLHLKPVIDKLKSKLFDLVIKEIISNSDFQEKKKEIDEQLTSVSKLIEQLQWQKRNMKSRAELIKERMELLKIVSETWNPMLSEDKKNMLLSSVVKNIVLNKKKGNAPDDFTIEVNF